MENAHMTCLGSDVPVSRTMSLAVGKIRVQQDRDGEEWGRWEHSSHPLSHLVMQREGWHTNSELSQRYRVKLQAGYLIVSLCLSFLYCRILLITHYSEEEQPYLAELMCGSIQPGHYLIKKKHTILHAKSKT